MRKHRKQLELIRSIAEEHGYELTAVEQNGKHPKAVLERGKHKHRVTFSGTPSDYRSMKNLRSWVKQRVNS